MTRGPKAWWMFYWWKWQGSVWPPAASPDPTPQAALDLDLKRHNEAPNWLFGDGHAKNGKLSQLWRPGAENYFWPSPP